MFIGQLFRRGFAEVAAATMSNKQLKLTLATPHQTILKDVLVRQVNISTEDGDLGVLAGHLPMVLQLRPGVIEVVSEVTGNDVVDEKKRYFGSGGFATINPDSTLQVAAMEAVPVEQLDKSRIATELAKAESAVASAKTDIEKVESTIQLQIFKAMAAA